MSRELAIVTGASRGIGAAIARTLAKRGQVVGVNCSSGIDAAEAVVQEIERLGGNAFLLPFDVADSTQVDAAFEKAQKEYGPIQVLVNNAGVTRDGLLMRYPDADLETVLNIDLKGAIYCSRAAIRAMARNRKGSIVQVSSVVGEMGNAGQSVYAAAKAGLIGFSKSLAKEVASRQVRVNVVSPGFIETQMTSVLTEAQKASIVQSIPLGLWGQPDDVAEAVAFLVSDQAKYITGQVIGVNGGMYM